MTENAASYSRLSVIVPVYNERNNVGEALRRMKTADISPDLEVEIIVVDDGSTDGTDKVLSAVEDSTVRVVKHSENRGKGAAIRTGLAEARGDIILLQGAGLEYNAADWPRLLTPMLEGRAKVVFGSRFHPERVTMPLTRLLADRAVSIAACLLFNTTLTDIETGMKVIDRKLLESLDIESARLEVEPELTAKLLRRGERIFEVPVNYSGREKGRGFSGRNGAAAISTLLRQRFAKA